VSAETDFEKEDRTPAADATRDPIAMRGAVTAILSTRSARLVIAAFASLALLAFIQSNAMAAGLDGGHPNDIGFQDHPYTGPGLPGAGTTPSASKPESKLWFNDGSWWGSLWSTSAGDFHIFRLNKATQEWIDTGVQLDNRGGTRADTLWDGQHLYVASHGFTNVATPKYPARLYRLSYDASRKTYVHDAGFPVAINDYKSETLVIDKDQTGTLWATWVQGTSVMVTHTVDGNDAVWAAPFVLPAEGAIGLDPDDISSVVQIGGDRVGIMWSNQKASKMYFAVHKNSDPAHRWTGEVAVSGRGNADDHISLKSDGFGFVYAVTKTSQIDDLRPLVYLLVRAPIGGWLKFTVGREEDSHTQPILLLDETNRMIHVFMSSPQAGGTIYHKMAPMLLPTFPGGLGTAFIESGAAGVINSATSTKQNISSRTGIAVLAVQNDPGIYWHNTLDIQAPGLEADFSGGPRTAGVPFSVPFRDRTIGNPSSWMWFFGDGGWSRQRNPSYTYKTPGLYGVTLVVTDNRGRISTIRRPAYIDARPLTADFTANPPAGERPITISFTDKTIGSPTSWSWRFGDGATSTQRNPSHLYTRAGNFSVTLTVRDAAGKTSSKTRMVSVMAAFPFTPVADAQVRSITADRNYGASPVLRVKHGGSAATAEHYRTYIRFNVSGLNGTVVTARLRLYVTDASTGGGTVYVSPAGWDELGLAWLNAPAHIGGALGTFGAVNPGTWAEVTLPASAFARGNGTYDLVIEGTHPRHGMSEYQSREGANPPQLLLQAH
jgi:PKD repeat protein